MGKCSEVTAPAPREKQVGTTDARNHSTELSPPRFIPQKATQKDIRETNLPPGRGREADALAAAGKSSGCPSPFLRHREIHGEGPGETPGLGMTPTGTASHRDRGEGAGKGMLSYGEARCRRPLQPTASRRSGTHPEFTSKRSAGDASSTTKVLSTPPLPALRVLKRKIKCRNRCWIHPASATHPHPAA